MSITNSQAQKIAAAAVAKAVEIGVPMNVAIIDQTSILKHFTRMDKALLGSADIALMKAKTAYLFNRESGEIGKLSQPGGPLYDIEQTNGGLVTFPGGVVIRDSAGNTIGAIGVSGGAVEEDYTVAIAALAAFDEKNP